jgi:hypothetical protein
VNLTPAASPVELTGRQRFELAYLCEKCRDGGRGTTDAALALVAGYALVEGITPEQFSPADRRALEFAYIGARAAEGGLGVGLYDRPPPGFTGTDVVTLAQQMFARYGAADRGPPEGAP